MCGDKTPRPPVLPHPIVSPPISPISTFLYFTNIYSPAALASRNVKTSPNLTSNAVQRLFPRHLFFFFFFFTFFTSILPCVVVVFVTVRIYVFASYILHPDIAFPHSIRLLFTCQYLNLLHCAWCTYNIYILSI